MLKDKIKKFGKRTLPFILATSYILTPLNAKSEERKNTYLSLGAGWGNLSGDLGEVFNSAPVYNLGFGKEYEDYGLEGGLSFFSSKSSSESRSSQGIFSGSSSSRSSTLSLTGINLEGYVNADDLYLGIGGVLNNIRAADRFFSSKRSIFTSSDTTEISYSNKTALGYRIFGGLRLIKDKNLKVCVELSHESTETRDSNVSLTSGITSALLKAKILFK